MRSILKKFLAATTALMMLLINVNAVFAEGPTGTITFHTGSSDVNGVTFNIYKIFDVTTSGSNVGYSVNSDFSKFFKDNNLTEDDSYAYVKNNVANTMFQNAVKGYVTSQSVVAKATLYGKTGQKTYTTSELEYGYYVIIPSGDNFTPSFTTLASANQDVYLKGTEPGVDKKVEDAEWTGAQIGDTVHFKVTSSVPNMTGYNKYYFKLTDTLSKGLTVTEESLNLTVKVGDTTLNKGNGDYTVNVSGQTITIEISNFINYKDQANEEIVFEYEAVLNENAVSANPETNTANVHWGNDPDHLEDGTPDIVNVRTYKLTITKTDGKEPLNGAEFELYKGSNVSSGSKLSFIKTGEGAYRVAKTGESGTTTLTTPTGEDNKGVITIEGLDEGTYQLVEAKAPDGYNKLEKPTEITILASSNNNGTSVTVSGNEVTVVNNAGTLLPETGGMGTMLFTLVGVAGILVVAYSFVAGNKKKKQVEKN